MGFSDAHDIPQWFHPLSIEATQNFHEDNRLGSSVLLVEDGGPPNHLVHHHFPIFSLGKMYENGLESPKMLCIETMCSEIFRHNGVQRRMKLYEASSAGSEVLGVLNKADVGESHRKR